MYLHVVALVDGRIVGTASGPSGTYVRYEVDSTGSVDFFDFHFADAPASRAFIKRFGARLMKRIDQESLRPREMRTNYSANQFYLRRQRGGIRLPHRSATAAIELGVLAREFCEDLQKMNVTLIYTNRSTAGSTSRRAPADSRTGRLPQ